MLRISPMCWVFGHSRGFNLRVLVTRKDAKCRVAVFCARCGAPLRKRLKKAVFQYPYHHPGRKPNTDQAKPRADAQEPSSHG